MADAHLALSAAGEKSLSYRWIKPAGPWHTRIIVAKHQLSASILSDMVRKREIHREYLAIVEGIPPENHPIGRKEGSAILREVNFENRLNRHGPISPAWRRENGLSLVSLKLETGRTHQIRVHMGYIGCPLHRRLPLLP